MPSNAGGFGAIYGNGGTGESISGSDVTSVVKPKHQSSGGGDGWIADLAAGLIAAAAVVGSIVSFGTAAPAATAGAVSADTALLGGTAAVDAGAGAAAAGAGAGAADVGAGIAAGATAADVGATAADVGATAGAVDAGADIGAEGAADIGAAGADVGEGGAVDAADAADTLTDAATPAADAATPRTPDVISGADAAATPATNSGETTIDEATTAGQNGPETTIDEANAPSKGIGQYLKLGAKGASAAFKTEQGIQHGIEAGQNAAEPEEHTLLTEGGSWNSAPPANTQQTIGNFGQIQTPQEGNIPTALTPNFSAIFGQAPIGQAQLAPTPKPMAISALAPQPLGGLANMTSPNALSITSDYRAKKNIKPITNKDFFNYLNGKHNG